MIYSESIESKTGERIPLFADQKPMHSKYNPHAERIVENPAEGFYIIGGIGGSFHIKSLLTELGSDSFILAVEEDKESLDFSLECGVTAEVIKDERVQFCTVDELSSMLLNLYLPVLYSSFNCFAQRVWENHAETVVSRINAIVREKLSSISADFSVQAHFGKQWQRNIIRNLAQVSDCPAPTVPSGKSASIIAAGPSLDKSIEELKQNIEKTVIFCTDTAYQVLRKHHIEPDYIVSIDCQNISLEHFSNIKEEDTAKKACVILDLGSSPEIAEKMRKRGHDVYFTSSFHPFSKLASKEFNIPVINSGSGTVAIAACDLALHSGARTIRLYGADFCYSSGKPYAKGTYLDSIYGKTSFRIFPGETMFSALMYRTELKECNPIYSENLINPRTSTVLESYSNALSEWAENNSFECHNGCLSLKSTQKFFLPEQHAIDSLKFLLNYLNRVRDMQNKSVLELKKDEYFYGILPFIAWQKNHLKDKNLSVFEHIKLAHQALKRYTMIYEE